MAVSWCEQERFGQAVMEPDAGDLPALIDCQRLDEIPVQVHCQWDQIVQINQPPPEIDEGIWQARRRGSDGVGLADDGSAVINAGGDAILAAECAEICQATPGVSRVEDECVLEPVSEDRVRPELALEEEEETELVDMRDPLSVRQRSTVPVARSSTARGDRRRSGMPEASVTSTASPPVASLRLKRTNLPDASSRSQASWARRSHPAPPGAGRLGCRRRGRARCARSVKTEKSCCSG